jgi:hypothetical protein
MQCGSHALKIPNSSLPGPFGGNHGKCLNNLSNDTPTALRAAEKYCRSSIQFVDEIFTQRDAVIASSVFQPDPLDQQTAGQKLEGELAC